MPTLEPRLRISKNVNKNDVIYQAAHQNDDLRPMVRIVCSIFFFFTLVALPMRFIAQRRVGIRRIQIDDILILICWFLFCGEYISAMYATTTGYGRHAIKVTNNKMWLKNSYLGYFNFNLYTISMTFLKVSVLFLYRRLFGVRKSIRVASLVVGAIVVGHGLGIFLANTIICTPNLYYQMVPKCLIIGRVLQIGTILNLVSDILVLAIPLHAIYQLHLPFRQRLAIAGIFITSSVSVVVTGVRIYYMKYFKLYSDPTYTNAKSLTMCIVEISVGIVCACLPLMQPLLRGWFAPKPRSTTSSGNPIYKFSDRLSSSKWSRGFGRSGGSSGDRSVQTQDSPNSPDSPTQPTRISVIVTQKGVEEKTIL